MLRLMLAVPRSRTLKVVDVTASVYAYVMLGLAGVLSCGFALGASVPLRVSVAEAPEIREAGRVAAQASASLDAFALRLGELQARLTRLEALGEQVRVASALDVDELDFTAPPPGRPMGRLPAAELARTLDELARTVDHRSAQFAVLDRVIGEQVASRDRQPSLAPIASAPVSSRYGTRAHPIAGKRLFHAGMDFAAPVGTPIHAAAAGLVTEAGWRSGYGYMVELDHGDGLKTRYGHNRENLVKAGDFVSAGQLIARVGRTGRVTGPHLHFEVRRGTRAENPAAYLPKVTGPGVALVAAR
jgi:murein DD-endopeptidase MepM/ murein hydrolase activator NlpD